MLAASGSAVDCKLGTLTSLSHSEDGCGWLHTHLRVSHYLNDAAFKSFLKVQYIFEVSGNWKIFSFCI